MFYKIRYICLAPVLALCLALTPAAVFAGQSLVLYTSVKEPLIQLLVQAFEKKHPCVSVHYLVDGGISIADRIMAEHQAGNIAADVVWTSAVSRFYFMKKAGLFEKYVSPAAPEAINPLPGSAGYFPPARFVIMGIAYNTNLVKDEPQEWSDIFSPEFKNAFGIADPAESGTAFAGLSLLINRFGWDFVERFEENRGRVSKSSDTVVLETEQGKLKACLAADYIAQERIGMGAPLALAYPPEMLFLPSPVAIFRRCRNLEAAERWVDFLLSREAQAIIASKGSLPVRPDVIPPARFKLPAPQEALSRAILGDYPAFAAQRGEVVAKFKKIMHRVATD